MQYRPLGILIGAAAIAGLLAAAAPHAAHGAVGSAPTEPAAQGMGPPRPADPVSANADEHAVFAATPPEAASEPSAQPPAPAARPITPPSRPAFAGMNSSGEPRPGTTFAGGAAAGQASPASTILSTLLPLACVLALAVGLSWVIRRAAARNDSFAAALGAGGKAPAGILEVLGRYPLSRQQTLILLRVDRRVLLLAQCGGRGVRMSAGTGGAGLSTLAEIDDPSDVASILTKVEEADGRSMARRFQSLLDRARDGEGLPADPHAPTERSNPPAGLLGTLLGRLTTHAAGVTGSRARQQSPEGDATELWDTSESMDALDPRVGAEHAPMQAAPETNPRRRPDMIPARRSGDPVAELRARLAMMASTGTDPSEHATRGERAA